MNKKQITYWLFQLLGWGFLFSLALINKPFSITSILKVVLVSLIGIVISHSIRYVFLKKNIIHMSFLNQFALGVINAIIGSAVFTGLQWLMYTYIFNTLFDPFDIIYILNISIYLIVWQVLYILYILRERNRLEEMNNLKLQALNQEVELSNLRSQLNPHFMFNALNSVKALIDEDKKAAKYSINLLSNVLRSILLSGKQQRVTLEDELQLIKDYLALEKIRFEDRLVIEYKIEDSILKELIPPLLLQTLVENSIKHGVAQRVNPTHVLINIFKDDKYLNIFIENDISTNNSIQKLPSTGIGVENLKKRLDLLYSKKAIFLFKKDEKAIVEIKIPLYI